MLAYEWLDRGWHRYFSFINMLAQIHGITCIKIAYFAKYSYFQFVLQYTLNTHHRRIDIDLLHIDADPFISIFIFILSLFTSFSRTILLQYFSACVRSRLCNVLNFHCSLHSGHTGTTKQCNTVIVFRTTCPNPCFRNCVCICVRACVRVCVCVSAI